MGYVTIIGTDFIDMLVAAEVSARKAVVLTDIFDFVHFCDFWDFLVEYGRHSEVFKAQGRVELGPRRSQEVRGSPELQNGGLRALGEARSTQNDARKILG